MADALTPELGSVNYEVEQQMIPQRDGLGPQPRVLHLEELTKDMAANATSTHYKLPDVVKTLVYLTNGIACAEPLTSPESPCYACSMRKKGKGTPDADEGSVHWSLLYLRRSVYVGFWSQFWQRSFN